MHIAAGQECDGEQVVIVIRWFRMSEQFGIIADIARRWVVGLYLDVAHHILLSRSRGYGYPPVVDASWV